MATLVLHGKTYVFEIIRRKRKTLEIQIDSELGFRVIAPKKLSEKAILALLAPKSEWIYQKIGEVEQMNALKVKRMYVSGECLWILGEPRILEVRLDPGAKRASAMTSGNALLVVTPSLEKEVVRGAVVSYMRQIAGVQANARMEVLARQLGVVYNRITIKDQKRRWGSCSQKRNLNFNWRCAMMPPDVFEYILCHEACHLVYMDHSPAYWALVESVCPGWKAARLWLRHNGGMLDI